MKATLVKEDGKEPRVVLEMTLYELFCSFCNITAAYVATQTEMSPPVLTKFVSEGVSRLITADDETVAALQNASQTRSWPLHCLSYGRKKQRSPSSQQ